MTHSFVSCSGAVVVKKKQLWDQYSIFSIGRKSFWGVQQFWDIHTSLLMISGNWEVFQPSEIQSIKHQRQFFPPHLLNYSWSSASILNHLQYTMQFIWTSCWPTIHPLPKNDTKLTKPSAGVNHKVHQTWMQLLPICIPFSNCMACQKRQNWKRPWPTMSHAHLRSMLLRRRFLNWKTLISLSSTRSAKNTEHIQCLQYEGNCRSWRRHWSKPWGQWEHWSERHRIMFPNGWGIHTVVKSREFCLRKRIEHTQNTLNTTVSQSCGVVEWFCVCSHWYSSFENTVNTKAVKGLCSLNSLFPTGAFPANKNLGNLG